MNCDECGENVPDNLRLCPDCAALNPRDAKCCCACAHWHKHGEKDGQCRNPKMRHGVTYKDKNTGEETHIEWLTTGCYHSCLNWTDASTPNAKLKDARKEASE